MIIAQEYMIDDLMCNSIYALFVRVLLWTEDMVDSLIPFLNSPLRMAAVKQERGIPKASYFVTKKEKGWFAPIPSPQRIQFLSNHSFPGGYRQGQLQEQVIWLRAEKREYWETKNCYVRWSFPRNQRAYVWQIGEAYRCL